MKFVVSKTAKVRFDFYQFIDHEDGSVCNINDLLNEIYNLPIKDREMTYFGNGARLDNYEIIDDFLVYFHMTRLRDEGIASTKSTDNELNDIDLGSDEFIAEDINCLFDTSANVIVIQRNSHSLSIKGVGKYLEKMYSKVHDEKEIELDIEFVKNKETFSKVKRTDQFNKLTLRAASAIKNPLTGPVKKVTGIFSGIFDQFDGEEVTITISAGKGKNKKELKKNSVLQTVQMIKDDKSLFSKALVTGKEGDAPVETFDLINGRLLLYRTFSTTKIKDNVTRKIHLNPEAVKNDIVDQYKRKGGYRELVIKNLS
jgi:hypothetical protein